MSDYFTDKIFIITGASSGLGLQFFKKLRKKQCQTVLFARDLSKLGTMVEDEVGPNPLVITGNVTKEEDVRRCIETTIQTFGRIDGMILNAGKSMWSKFCNLKSPQEIREIMEVNYWGVVNFCYHGLPHIKKSRGRVVTISSLQSIIGVPYHTGYSASKHALNGFIESLRLEEDISVLNVVASWIRGTSLRENSLGFQGGEDHTKTQSKNGLFSISVDDCARKIIEVIPRNKKTLYLPWIVSLFPLVKYLLPDWLGGKIKKAVDKEIPNTTF